MSKPANASHSDDPALLAIDGPIATITLNRPAAFNSIDLSIAKKLEQLGAETEASDDIKVLVIQGEGRAFCAGLDMGNFGKMASGERRGGLHWALGGVFIEAAGTTTGPTNTPGTAPTATATTVLAAHTTSAPASASPTARPRPMPREAPVTMATFPSSGVSFTAQGHYRQRPD